MSTQQTPEQREAALRADVMAGRLDFAEYNRILNAEILPSIRAAAEAAKAAALARQSDDATTPGVKRRRR